MKRLLLVEDDRSLGATLHERLLRERYDVAWVETTGMNGNAPVNDMEVGALHGAPTIIYGTGKGLNGGTEISGLVAQVELDPKARAWGDAADARGKYTISKDVPPGWLFGPYVVEVNVDWTDHVVAQDHGVSTARDILQSARFYDYFLVTPPNSVNPPSPVYDIHLVAWMNDWR